MSGFGDTVTTALRTELGDWRDPISWTAIVSADFNARSAFYVEQGLNPLLTMLPSAAFEEAVEAAELDEEFDLVEAYGTPIPPSSDEEEEADFERTSRAHNWLIRLETQLRRFIEAKMIENFGPDWMKHRLPKQMLDSWVSKRDDAERSSDVDRPLIAFADFTDYVPLICKKDNWPVFKPYFQRMENVTESLQRLYPLRNDTMHSRLISQDDELYVYSESKRIVTTITRRPTKTN
jgi:hypothetical protein